ncbi:MAG: Coenzyme F420 hydrogenase/dehydrogenase, beta subunit C-terminal domain [Promethearchaeota archaeon]|jgi:coenzyme F420 hydrogenase subunit beta
MSSKTFQDLINEVHDKGICQECGGCVSFCSSADYNIIGFEEDKPYSPPIYINKESCLECGICYYICPQTHILDDELNKTHNFSDFHSEPLGSFQEILSCQSNDKGFLERGTDGGVVNTIINYLLEKKLIDGAIVAKTKVPFSRDATFVEDKDGLIQNSGATLEVSSHLDEIQKYCTYTHSIPQLNFYKFKKLAVVGTPCQIYTIRCMQDLGVTPSENIEICLGLFCYENFLFDKSQVEKFETEFDVKFENITKINIKETLILKLRDEVSGERIVQIPFDRLKDYMRPACNACSDFTNIYADISFGGLGSNERFTTVIPRTKKGKDLISAVISEKIIKCADLDTQVIDKMKDKISEFSHSKTERKEKYMNNIIME